MKFIIGLGLCFVLVSAAGCKKFLDTVPNDRLTLEEVFNSRESADKFLRNIYSYIPREKTQRWVGNYNSGPWTGAADEAEYLWGFVESNAMNIGSWDAGSGFTKSFWRDFYKAIRSASIFIDNIDKVTIDLSAEQKKQHKAEARALRAIYYFYLTRIYGPVVIIPEAIPVDATSDMLNLPRNSMEECVNYIVSELELAAADLPVQNSNNDNRARITKPIALAFIGRAHLQGASPLYNGNPDYASLKNNDGKQLISQTFDVNKYRQAADAFKSFIDQFVPSVFQLYRKNDENGNFSPFLSVRDVVLFDWIF